MTYGTHGSILGLRARQAQVLLLTLASLCGLSGLRAQGQCDPQSDEVKPLIQVLRDKELQKKDPDRVRQAILQLGYRGCAAAADDLAALLAFKYRFGWEGTMIGLQPTFTPTRYPATGALAQIGKASLPSLVKVIEANSPSSLMTRNAIYTVKSIYRDHPDKAESYLREAAEKATKPESQSRLSQAAAALPGIELMDFKRYQSSAPQ
jgi:predicted Zn-dependent peptidase